jgi:hypothetical protein
MRRLVPWQVRQRLQRQSDRVAAHQKPGFSFVGSTFVGKRIDLKLHQHVF